MRTVLVWLVSVAIFCLASDRAISQTIFSDFLTFDGGIHHVPPPFQGGGEDKIQDDSLSKWFDFDDSETFSDGDVVVSMITLSEINSSGAPSMPVGENSQIAILASLTISGLGSAGSYNLVPTAADSPASLQSLLDPSISGVAGLDADSVAVVISTSTPATNPADDPLNWTFAQISTDFSVANNWAWEATVRLGPDPEVFAEAVEIIPGFPLLGGLQRGAFDIQGTAFPAVWEPVDVWDFGNNSHFADITLDVAVFVIASGDELQRGWTFRDQSSFFVNPNGPGDCAARTIGFWGNKHGLGIIEDLMLLDDLAALNLRDQDGSHFDPTTTFEWCAWLRRANAENMAYMLSAQMAGMFLNIQAGFVAADDIVMVEKQDGTIAYLEIGEVVDAANEVLGLNPDGMDGLLLVEGEADAEVNASDYVTTLAMFEGTLRKYAGFLKDILDDANNNLNWLNCAPPPSVMTVDH